MSARFAFAFLVLAAASAVQPAPPAAADPLLAALDQGRPADTPAPDATTLAVLEELTRRATRTRLEPDRDWLSQLGSMYAVRGAPLWIGADGHPTEKAAAVADEIRRAEFWGLDARAFDLPAAAGGDVTRRAAAEVAWSLAITKYAWHARGGRVDPSQLSRWLDQKPRAVDAAAVVEAVHRADEPAAVLRSFHPRHPHFEALRQEYVRQRGLVERARERPIVPPGPRLKAGDVHMDVRYLRRRLDVPGKPGEDTVFDRELGEALAAYTRSLGGGSKRVLDDRVRALLNDPPPPRTGKDVDKLLVNMERWRWLPDDLGRLHIWNNLPEYETRVVKDGQVIHRERIIVGKPSTQTPVFSDYMRFVVFQPEWVVPSSIKVKQLLPALRYGDYDELDRRNMRILGKNGRSLPPDYFDWSRTDIRYVPIAQGPGYDNPLGELKFMFPNKHDVYMHDTSSKHLFQSSTRTFSAGCIRVRNPRRLAEIVFGETSGWNGRQVLDNLSAWAPENNRVDLASPIPVHNTYFTMVPDGKGGVRSLPDVYGHDRRIDMALKGTPAQVIAAQDPALALQREIEELAPDRPGQLVRARREKRRWSVDW